jgi:hypothetical protein
MILVNKVVLGKASKDANNLGGWLILLDLFEKWVAKGVASEIHDFKLPMISIIQFFFLQKTLLFIPNPNISQI